MATNLQIDDELLAQAKALGGHKTKRETVNSALREYVQSRSRMGLIDLMGKIEFDPDYDYKSDRRRSTDKGLRKARGE